jgi:hypothetical protein
VAEIEKNIEQAVELIKYESEETPLLPRQTWNNQLAFLKAILKAKQALERAENSLKLEAEPPSFRSQVEPGNEIARS